MLLNWSSSSIKVRLLHISLIKLKFLKQPESSFSTNNFYRVELTHSQVRLSFATPIQGDLLSQSAHICSIGVLNDSNTTKMKTQNSSMKLKAKFVIQYFTGFLVCTLALLKQHKETSKFYMNPGLWL